MTGNMKKIEVVPIPNRKKDIKQFVLFSWKIYKDNSYWVPPIISDQMKFITQGSYHDTGVIQAFMAYRNGDPVGRIIAHYDTRYNALFQKARGCIGFFECVDDKEVSRALFDTSRKWLVEKGMNEMYGPLNFTNYDASGLLMDDYENDTALELNYNLPYYTELFEDYGFHKVIDWYAYRFTRDQDLPDIAYRLKERIINNRSGIRFRNADFKNYWEEARSMLGVFNKAWEENWGHLPLTERQWHHYAKEVKTVAKPEFVMLAEKEGQVIGYILAVPDVNQVLKRINGRLFPFGLFKIILGLRKINRIKIYHMGVLPKFRKQGIETLFILEIYERAKKKGYKEADISLVVENNTSLIRLLDRFGAERYKTYRHFTKSIAVR